MKSGNTSINIEAFKDSTKEEFVNQLKGRVAHDIDELWDEVCKLNGKDASVKKHSTKRKERVDSSESNVSAESEPTVHESDN